MKNKKLAILVVLLLVFGAGVYTYARYSSTIEGTGTVDVAKWAVEVSGTDATTEKFSLNLSEMDNADIAEGKIAPGGAVSGTIELDLTGTEVSTDYIVTIGDVSSLPVGVAISSIVALYDGNTIELNENNDFTGTLTYEQIAQSGIVELTITVEWTNDDANNTTDTLVGEETTELTIPVEVTVQQHISN